MDKEKLYSRKEMLQLTGKSLAGVAMVGAIPTFLVGCGDDEKKGDAPAETENKEVSEEPEELDVELPTADVVNYEYAEPSEDAAPYPYPYEKLDVEKAQERAHAGYYDIGGCCRGVADGVIGELADVVGYPFNQIPIDMFANGTTGYGAGSLCGALGGAVAAIGLVCEDDDAKELTKELFDWYRNAELPEYQPNEELETTVAGSVNCDESVGGYMEKTGAKMGDDIRKERCACVSGDVAGKTVELLNDFYNL